MTLYKNKYRVESHRLKGWNYANSGCYFLTICTQYRTHWFGKIQNGKMQLSNLGQIVNDEWLKSFEIRDELFAGDFVIMPNHIHGIVVIDDNGRDERPFVSTGKQMKPKSISSFMAGFKSATVKKIDDYIDKNKLDMEKFNRENQLWQRNYWDRIIRNEKEYDHITGYIYNNPENWENDDLNERSDAQTILLKKPKG